jgi:glycerol-3-phosphate dehydrogenase
MWYQNWRNEIWSQIDAQPWDLLIVGGGITGAGILREATRLGLRTLLVEQRDFAWGTSSRSSKLVHGGLRYLKEGQLGLTLAAVQERQQLLAEGPGLIEPLGFLWASYKGDRPGRLVLGAGLTVYDLLALQWSHKYYSVRDFQMLAPHLTSEDLQGGFRYGDAQTDDARLVLRLIREAVADGGVAINYVKAEKLLPDREGRVTGVQLHDSERGKRADVHARIIINATGAWTDQLRVQVGAQARIRPLRGSHLIFPRWRVPVAQAVSFLHPLDGRPVFLLPWEGITLLGTTDFDHQQPLNEEPRITPEEVAYLMAAVEAQFPSLDLTLDDIISSFAGVRPVIGSGKVDPSQESRDHVVWQEDGLLTVTGGKLTTFRLIALDVIEAVRHLLPELPPPHEEQPVLNPVDVSLPSTESLDERTRRRLLGRYGVAAPALVAAARPGELDFISGTPVLWAELRWAARAEGVVHLDDLLLRRVRLGLMLDAGGQEIMPRIRSICQPELSWDDGRWLAEQKRYLDLWYSYYSLPDREAVPDWSRMLAEAQQERESTVTPRARLVERTLLATAVIGLVLLLGWLWFGPRRRQPG